MQHREPSEGRFGGALRVAAICVLILAYTGLSHYCNTRTAPRLGAALALAPAIAVALALLGQALRLPLALLAAAAGALVLYYVWPLLEKNFAVVNLLQESGMYGLLAVGFGRSLRAGDVALCTRFADKLHGPLNAAEVRYTRQVTLAWTFFFALLAALVAILFVAASRAAWSAFVNFATLPLIAVMFVAEYLVRGRVLPHTERRGIWASMRIFFVNR